MKFRAAIAQVDARVGDIRHNIEHHLSFVERAVKERAQLIVFPELSLTGYTLRDLVWDVAIDPETEKLLAPLKKRSKTISIAFGLVENGADHGIYNSAVFLEGGSIRHIHRKVYLPSYGMFEEGRYFSRGGQVRAFDSRLGRIGMLVCEDLWHLPLPYILAHDGAEVILSLTASPTRLAGDSEAMEHAAVNHEHHRAYARLLSSYLLFSNRVGFEDGVNFWGGSSIIGPSGTSLALGKYFSEDLIVADIKSADVRRARRLSRHFLDDDPRLVMEHLSRMFSEGKKER